MSPQQIAFDPTALTDADLDVVQDALAALYHRHATRRDEIRSLCERVGFFLVGDDE